jgi:hypothetical protein
MKKNKTQLQLTKTTVRVLQDAELAAVRGGGGGGRAAVFAQRTSTNDPTACIVGDSDRCDGAV